MANQTALDDGDMGPRPHSAPPDDRTSRLEATLSSFIQAQQARDERWERETERQDLRWRSVQHQFQQLQMLVSTEHLNERPTAGAMSRSPEPELPEDHSPRQDQPRASSASLVSEIPRPVTDQSPESTSADDRSPGQQQPRVRSASPMSEPLRPVSVTPSVYYGWSPPKMTPYKDDEDIEHYLTTFERLALANQWPRSCWAVYLVPLLTGKARAAYIAMDIQDTMDYVKVKDAILNKFEIDHDTYRHRFRSTTLMDGETARELQARLNDLYIKWMRPEQKTKAEIGDAVILEQFLRMLNPELRIWVKERNPRSSKEAADLAEAYIGARRHRGIFQLGGHDTTGRRSHTPQRDPARQPSGKSVGGGGREFSRSYSSPVKPNTPAKPKPRVVCYNCGQPGHIKPECPIVAVSEAKLCYNPDNKAHPLRHTPSTTDSIVPVTIKGRKWQALIDTGSSQTFIRRTCLDPNDCTNAGKVRVRCIHGDESEHQTADIDIDIEGQKYLLTVGIMDSCPYPVVLGQDVPVLVELLQHQSPVSLACVTTRSQAKAEQADKELLAELPFPDSQPDRKPRKTRSVRRRDKVLGTPLQGQFPLPPMDGSVVESADFKDLQKADMTLKQCFEKVVSEEEAIKVKVGEKDCFVVRDGMLMRVSEEGEQVVVPESLRSKVLHLAHSVPWSGHLGQQKTLARVAKRFYWPKVYQEVIQYCKSCSTCQLTSRTHRGTRAPLISMPIIDTPFSRIAMDIVGPLEKSSAGHRYILVICDYATRFPEAYPLRNVKSRQVANCLIQLFSRVGIPSEIITDQGTNFNSRFMKQVYSLLGIRPIRTTPYHPQTDGLVERFNQTLKAMLRKFVCDSGADWDQWLPYLLFAYREVPQASTGYSPFELLYGRQVRGPLDVLKEAWTGEGPAQQTSVAGYVLKMRAKLEELRSLAHDNLAQAQSQQKTLYDQTARSRSFNPGQKVLLLLPSSGSSLLAKWQGPFEVLSKVGPVTYELAMPDRRRPRQKFHINLLKEWVSRPDTVSHLNWARVVEEEEELKEQYFPTRGDKTPSLPLQHLSSQQQADVQQVIPEGLFREEPGRTTLIQHSIRLTGPGPIRQTSYRVPARLITALKQEVKAMLDMGVIVPSHSEWCSPVVLVPKKDGGLRFCVDFSKLNSISAFDPYPMPRVDEMVERLGKAQYLSTLDLCKGYWQVPLTPEAQELTAFRAPSGLYHFTTMPFGLHGAAATFQRLMDQVLRGAETYAAAYIDDVIIFSSSWEEHRTHLADVFRRISEAGLVVNAGKCQLARPEVCYLGYVLGGGNIKPQVSKVEAVRDCPPPTTKKGVRSFLGLVGWYRRFIPSFSSRAALLTNLTRKSSPNKVVWTEDCQKSFEDLKDCLCNSPVLQSPNFDLPFTVQTDASGLGLGAVLLQGEGEDRRPVQYISRKLFARETRYSTVEKECLAIKWALDSLRYYLLGKQFVLETDHRALQWLNRMRDSNARVTRWYLSLQPYSFTIRYKAGKDNITADFLSRLHEEVQA